MANADLSMNVDAVLTMAARVQPGDTILIGFDRSLSDDEFDRLREDFEDFTEATGVHIAFVEHATSMVVAKGGEGDGRPGCIRNGVLRHCDTDCCTPSAAAVEGGEH